MKIIENTVTDGTDQSHLKVYHFSRSTAVPDRTKFLLGEITENPGEGMAEVMRALKAAAESHGGIAVAGVPCNTFHAPPVWNRFRSRMEELGVTGETVRIVHMLEETVRLIQELVPNCRKIGLMSTTGTRKSRVYHNLLEPKGYEVVEVPESMQTEVHDTIYNKEWGIKAVSPVTEKAVANFQRFARTIIKSGADAVILGCTEIPLAMPDQEFEGVPLVDPVVALARAMIAVANPKKLQPLNGRSDHEQVLFWRVSRRKHGDEIFRAAMVGSLARHWRKKASESLQQRQRLEIAKFLWIGGAIFFTAFALGRRSK